MKYDYSVNYDEFLTVLQRKREIDLKYASTGAGPHRDDIEFLVNGIDIRRFGSQGQQRTAALSLKLAQIELVKGRPERHRFCSWMMCCQNWTAAGRIIFWTVLKTFRL